MSNDTKITTREDVSRTTDKPAKPKRRIDNWPLFIVLVVVGVILSILGTVAIGRKIASEERDFKTVSVVTKASARARELLEEITLPPPPPVVREIPRPEYPIVKLPDTSFPDDTFRVVARLDKTGTIRVILYSGNREWEFVCENRGDMKRE